MPDLRPGQYRRLGRIAETNPERAKIVASRMENRAANMKRKDDEFIKQSENKVTREQRGKSISRPDTPLAPTPEPITDSNRRERLNAAFSRSELLPKVKGLLQRKKLSNKDQSKVDSFVDSMNKNTKKEYNNATAKKR